MGVQKEMAALWGWDQMQRMADQLLKILLTNLPLDKVMHQCQATMEVHLLDLRDNQKLQGMEEWAEGTRNQ